MSNNKLQGNNCRSSSHFIYMVVGIPVWLLNFLLLLVLRRPDHHLISILHVSLRLVFGHFPLSHGNSSRCATVPSSSLAHTGSSGQLLLLVGLSYQSFVCQYRTNLSFMCSRHLVCNRPLLLGRLLAAKYRPHCHHPPKIDHIVL